MILWCLEAGLINQWKVQTWARMKAEEGDVMTKDEEPSTIVTLDHVQGAFYLYLVMLFIASFIFGVEMFRKWKGKRGKRVFKFTL